MPDGSQEVFAQSNNAGTYPRRVFLSQVIDAAGNPVFVNYDPNFTATPRISSILDPLGQGLSLSYHPNDNLKITKVTEVMPSVAEESRRHADFEHENGKLEVITDMIGIQSIFTYKAGTDFIEQLDTPYGTSRFEAGQTGTTRWIEMTDPELGKERVEYQQSTSGVGSNEPVPNGFNASGLDHANTFYWDKKMYGFYPDKSKAHITHWLYNADGSVSGIKGSEKAPLENRVWYAYKDQPNATHVGKHAKPIKVARLLDDNSLKLWQYEYENPFAKLTKAIDPVGRIISYDYHPNNIDLWKVRQTTGSNNELLRSLTYNSQHEPLTDTDAASQTTTYQYNSFGQVTSVENAKGETTIYSYGSTVPTGYLRSITSPQFGGHSAVTSISYDDFRRVHTVTNEVDNYTVTTIYDELDRPTLVTYSDSPQTTKEFKYTEYVNGVDTGKKLLDATQIKDRRGHWTYREFDGNRRLTQVTDRISNSPVLDRVTQYLWCTCGAMTDIIDPKNHVTHFERDLQSRVTSKTFGYGSTDATTQAYTYENTTSRLKSMTDARIVTRNYSYHNDDNLKDVGYLAGEAPDPGTPSITFGYDPNYNRVTKMIDGAGTTDYSYYPITANPSLGAGQLKDVDGPLANDTITYGYDELGRVTSRTINGVASSVGFDSLGRLNTSDNILGHFDRVYDGTFNLAARVKTITNPSPNSQTANYDYYDNSNDRRLKTLTNSTGSLVNISKFDYSNYDAEGQIGTWVKELSQSVPVTSNFVYNLVDELRDVTNTTPGNPPTSLSYTYDRNGNRTSDNATPVYTHDAVNEITNTGYTHDLNGNMTADGVREYSWDAANRLTKITYPGTDGTTEFSYDGLGRRVQMLEKDGNGTVQRTSKFVWDGATIAEERSGSNTVMKRFLPEGVQIPANASPNQKLYYSRDHLGSVRSVTNENGAVRSTIDYDPYGTISLCPVPANSSSGGPVITGAVSRLTHGSAGDYDIALPLSGAPGIEPRNNSGNYTLVLTFDRPVNSGTATLASGVGTIGVPTFSSNAATVLLSGVADRQTIVVQLENVSDGSGSTAKVFVAMSVLVGDVNQNGAVTIADVNLIKANLAAPVNGSTFKCDTNHNGAISSADVSQTQSLQNQGSSMFPDFAFTGHYYHARSGLYLAPYRAYSPSIGRWLSRDPLQNADLSEGPNLYTYVHNNPVHLIDPLGLAWWNPFDWIQTLLFGSPGAKATKCLIEKEKCLRGCVDNCPLNEGRLNAWLAKCEAQCEGDFSRCLLGAGPSPPKPTPPFVPDDPRVDPLAPLGSPYVKPERP